MIKAIQTEYKGYRFRSRLEARWAVFFDAAEIEWDYEPEGFDLGDAGYYLPDFYLPKEGLWVEVKAKDLSETEREKAYSLSSQTDSAVICLNQIHDPKEGDYSNSLLMVKQYVGAESKFAENCYFAKELINFYLENACGNIEELSQSENILKDALYWDCGYYYEKHGKPHNKHFVNGYINIVECFNVKNLKKALTKARSARFEHGEKG